MKILFTAVGNEGHINPMLPLAEAFRAAGHKVAIATGQDMCPQIAAQGLEGLAAGLSATEQRNLAGPLRAGLAPQAGMAFAMQTLFTRIHAPRMVPDLLLAIDGFGPDLIVHESAEFAAPLAGTLRGVPFVHHSYGVLRPPELQRLAAESMAELWRDYGRDMSDGAGMFTNLYLDVCPPGLQAGDPPCPRLPLRMVALVPSSAAVRSDRSQVLLTFGTVFHRDATMVADLARKVARLPIDLVVTTGPGVSPAAFEPQPANVRVVPYVPLADVLPTCAAVVTHGGSGTVLASLAHGVPLVLVPQGADHFLNVERVGAAGAGIVADAETVTERLELVLGDPRYRREARRLGGEMALMSSPAVVADQLVGWVADR